jgi:hypothetical protein
VSYQYGPTAGPAPVRRRRRRWPLVLVLVLVLLVALFVVADRVALGIAEDRAATTLQNSENLSTKPKVDVAGFPFLTQFLAGKFDSVTISDHDVDVGGDRTLHIDAVVVHLHTVTVPHDYSQVRARTATADARINYSDLSDTLGVPVRYAGGGRISARASATVLGQTVRGTVSAVPQASNQDGITFNDPKVVAAGLTLPAAASQALAKVFSTAISLAGLPFRVQVEGASAGADGIHLRLSGRDLVYHR